MKVLHAFTAVRSMVLSLLLVGMSVGNVYATVQWHPGHYILASSTDTPAAIGSILTSDSNFSGFIRKYQWRDLETAYGVYDFSAIQADLNALPTGKYLIIQLQIATFDGSHAVPDYMLTGSGSAAYRVVGASSTVYKGEFVQDGAGSRRYAMIWLEHPTGVFPVRARFQALFTALSNFNFANSGQSKIESIVLPETAVSDTANPGDRDSTGYSRTTMVNACCSNLDALHAAFPTKTVIQYINRLLPADETAETAAIDLLAQYAELIEGAGIGGPDVTVGPYPTGFTELPSYPVIRNYAGRMPISMAVQFADYDSPNTRSQVFAKSLNDLGCNYVAWLNTNAASHAYKFGASTTENLSVRQKVNVDGFPSANQVRPGNM